MRIGSNGVYFYRERSAVYRTLLYYASNLTLPEHVYIIPGSVFVFLIDRLLHKARDNFTSERYGMQPLVTPCTTFFFLCV